MASEVIERAIEDKGPCEPAIRELQDQLRRCSEERAAAIAGLVSIHNVAAGTAIRERAERALSAAKAEGWYPRSPEAQHELELRKFVGQVRDAMTGDVSDWFRHRAGELLSHG